jgi:succinate dehydrogenase / fumarate reductase cytochrome b subunit
MSEAVVADTHAGDARGAFIRARLGSALAVAPLGVWTLLHLWNNLSAFDGAARWQADVTTYASPVAHALVMLVVLGPLAVHTVWGLGRMLRARPNNDRYKGFANLRYVLQRVSAIGLVLFLGAHLWLAMLKPRLTTGHAETFADISHEMHFHGPTLAVYVLGVLGIAYHLANGVSGFAMGWGVVQSQAGLKKLDALVWALFVGTLGLGYAVIYALYAAGR